MIKDNSHYITIAVKVTPKSHQNEVIGWENEELRVRIRGVPEKGNANETLIRFLAKFFELPVSALKIVSGATSRHKRISISGMSVEVLLMKTSEKKDYR